MSLAGRQAADRGLPRHIASVTCTAGSSTSMDLSAFLGAYVRIGASAKVHINAATATTAHMFIAANGHEDFRVKRGATTLYCIAASGSALVTASQVD